MSSNSEQFSLTDRLIKHKLDDLDEHFHFFLSNRSKKVAAKWNYSIETVEQDALDFFKENIINILEIHRDSDLEIVESFGLWNQEGILALLKKRLAQTCDSMEKRLILPAVKSWMTEIKSNIFDEATEIHQDKRSVARLQAGMKEILLKNYEIECDKSEFGVMDLIRKYRSNSIMEQDKKPIILNVSKRTIQLGEDDAIYLKPSLCKLAKIIIEAQGDFLSIDDIAKEYGNENVPVQKYTSEINRELCTNPDDYPIQNGGKEGLYRLKPIYQPIIIE